MAVLSAPSCMCSYGGRACVRRLTIPHAWPTCVRSLSCVRTAGVRAPVVLRYRMRGQLACALSRVCVWAFVRVYDAARGCLACVITYVRKRLACIRGRRHTCASRAVYLSCELFPTFRLIRAATLI